MDTADSIKKPAEVKPNTQLVKGQSKVLMTLIEYWRIDTNNNNDDRPIQCCVVS